jgi:uncharacterized membrane protein
MKQFSLYAMAVLYIAAGINHFVNPGMYVKIMPPWLPYPAALVLISGIFELAAGSLLLIPSTRRLAAWLIILLLIAVFPANIQMLLNYQDQNNPLVWMAVVRLPLQLLLIWWAYGFTKRQELKN